MDLNTKIFEVRIWIWLLILFVFFCGSLLILWINRYRIRKYYWKLRKEEKLIRVIMHFDSGLYKVFWRLMPSDKLMQIDNDTYIYNPKLLSKLDEKPVSEKDKIKITNQIKVKIGNKDYNIDYDRIIINKDLKYPEVHYNYGDPKPLDFKSRLEKSDLTSEEMQQFKDNDLFKKLLEIDAGQTMIMFILLLMIINCLLTFFIIAKQMGWLDKH